MHRDLRRRRAREENLTTGLQKTPVEIEADDNDQHVDSRKTRPASAPIRSRARTAAAAQPPRCSTAEGGANRFAPRATPSVAARQGGSAHLPVTPEARAASSTGRPAATRPYGTTLLANSKLDGLVAGPCGTPPLANPNRNCSLVAEPHGTTHPHANSKQDGLETGVSARPLPPSSSSPYSPVSRPASAGARAFALVASRPKNSMQARTAVCSLDNN